MQSDKIIWRCDLVSQYHIYKEKIDEAIQQVLNSGRYTLGTEVDEFEREFADYIQTEHATGVASGTDGLIISLKALNIGDGDEVITTPFTSIPTVSAVIATGATPVFVDICPDTFLIDLDIIKNAITEKTKAVMPVHIFGNVVDIKKLKEILPPNISIIEDACQAHGSRIKGILAGSMGDLGVFSFYPTKNLGGYGDGGIVVTNNQDLAEKIRLLHMYGMTDKDHVVINGVNSRLDELQAAILRVKLKYLDEMNSKRNMIAKQYKTKLSQDLFHHQIIPKNVYSNYHVFVSRFKGNREKLIKYLNKKKIQTNIYYPIPLHLQRANEFLGLKKGDLPAVESLCNEVIALPMYPELTHQKTHKIIMTINEFIKNKGYK